MQLGAIYQETIYLTQCQGVRYLFSTQSHLVTRWVINPDRTPNGIWKYNLRCDPEFNALPHCTTLTETVKTLGDMFLFASRILNAFVCCCYYYYHHFLNSNITLRCQINLHPRLLILTPPKIHWNPPRLLLSEV